MRKCEPVEYPGREWRCARDLGGSGLLPSSLTECFMSRCPGRHLLNSELEDLKAQNICKNCNSKPIAPSRKYYCSNYCKNAAARKAYNERKLNPPEKPVLQREAKCRSCGKDTAPNRLYYCSAY